MKIYDVLKNKCSSHIAKIYSRIMTAESEGVVDMYPQIEKLLLTPTQSKIISDEYLTKSPRAFRATFETLIFVNSLDSETCKNWAFNHSRGNDSILEGYVKSMLTYPEEIITKEGRTAGRVAFELIRKKAVLNKSKTKILSYEI